MISFQFVNKYGTWVRIDTDSFNQYGTSPVNRGEAWTLAVNKHGVTYMKKIQSTEEQNEENRATTKEITSSAKKCSFSQDVLGPSGSQEESHQSQIQNCISNTDHSNEEDHNSFFEGKRDCEVLSDKEMKEELPKIIKNNLKDKIPKVKDKESIEEGVSSVVGAKLSVLQKWLKGEDKTAQLKRTSSGPARYYHHL